MKSPLLLKTVHLSKKRRFCQPPHQSTFDVGVNTRKTGFFALFSDLCLRATVYKLRIRAQQALLLRHTAGGRCRWASWSKGSENIRLFVQIGRGRFCCKPWPSAPHSGTVCLRNCCCQQ